MWNSGKKLPRWTAILQEDKNNGREEGQREGSKWSSRESLALDSEFTQQQSKSFSSAWKPVWYTGWHTGVLGWAASVIVVLFINVGLTIYVATNPKYRIVGGIGTLYTGSCDKSKTIGLWLHLGINALSTILLSGSNYTQQCLAAPTRSEIDVAHASRRWMDIGVPSIQNLFRIKWERRLFWIAIGLTSIPLHLLYNSTVYTSLAANQYFITIVTNDHFGPRTYRNMSDIGLFQDWSLNQTGKRCGDIGNQTNSPEAQLFISVLEGNPSVQGYEDLTPLECAKVYQSDFVFGRSNVFLITKPSPNAWYNNTILHMNVTTPWELLPSQWMCSYNLESGIEGGCDPSEVVTSLTSGLPWRVELRTVGAVEIAGCKSEITYEECKVHFSLDIMIVVICCNLVKACCMFMAVIRSQEPTLVTLGDAVDSFLRVPDPTTMEICFADIEFIQREWRHGWRTGPRQWKQKGVQRWWTSVSKTRWITCNFFCSIAIIAAAVLLGIGMKHDKVYLSTDLTSMWDRGFGRVSTVSQFTNATSGNTFVSVTQLVLLANLPQTILSFLYLTYNSLFTCMLSAHEWSLFSHHHRALRVTSPRPGQRSTYWLQLPYTYAIPLMTLSGLLHWLTSQSLFLVEVDIFDPFGFECFELISTLGYSCLAIIFVLTLAILALLTAAAMGYKKFAAEITTVSSYSAAISAACHAFEANPEEIIGKKIRWGDVGIIPTLVVRHLTFSSEKGVTKPVFREAYAGNQRD